MANGHWQLEGTTAELYQRHLCDHEEVGRGPRGSRAASRRRGGAGCRVRHRGRGRLAAKTHATVTQRSYHVREVIKRVPPLRRPRLTS